jgi:hypothetical protein
VVVIMVDTTGVLLEGTRGGTVCRGYALRGANFITRDLSDPSNKICITMVSHANPGGGLPQWAMNTAINTIQFRSSHLNSFTISMKVYVIIKNLIHHHRYHHHYHHHQ